MFGKKLNLECTSQVYYGFY